MDDDEATKQMGLFQRFLNPMGSVKDLKTIREADVGSPGWGRFIFSDRYSVFDWGEMPDTIPHKGEAIALLAAYFFERLGDAGVPTHYLGLVEDGKAMRLARIKRPSNTMEVALLRVLKPILRGEVYDYSIYAGQKGNLLIPLEVIYRNSLPEGSSVFRRLKEGQMIPSDLGLKEPPQPGERLKRPMIDVSTKLEITDRYVTCNEAQRISGMSDAEVIDLRKLALKICDLITKEFERVGLVNEDGKFEFAFDLNRRLMLVDVSGTLDECRATFDGLPVSKEILRIFYRKTPWYAAVEEAKKMDRQNWKIQCPLKPEPLPQRLKQLVSEIYCGCTNELTGRRWFSDVGSLRKVLAEIKGTIGL